MLATRPTSVRSPRRPLEGCDGQAAAGLAALPGYPLGHLSCRHPIVSVAGETLLIAGSVAGLLPLDAHALHSVFLVGDNLSGKR
jgi:hypothetical protein